MKNCVKGAVIVAAGSSSRFGSDKLRQALFDDTVLRQTIKLFDGLADEIVVVGNETLPDVKTVEGGSTRGISVQNGLAALSPECKIVAVHDGARPFVSRSLIQKLYDVCAKFGSAVPFLPVTDTLWHGGNAPAPTDRSEFFTVQTPQVFDFHKLKAAFEACGGKSFSDESSLFCHVYGGVHFVEGEYSNKKITVPTDLPKFRVGNGFDVHAFGLGSEVILGGVHIPFGKKLVGHSDADVLTHAICDAVLSASGNRDIGVQFPESDDRYLGANSLCLLERCVELAAQNGFCMENVSATIICQLPKLSPYLDEMSQNLASVLKISPRCVNLSATTTEHLGALGNGDGIAAQAYALLSQKL